jgi:hypothetical protein
MRRREVIVGLGDVACGRSWWRGRSSDCAFLSAGLNGPVGATAANTRAALRTRQGVFYLFHMTSEGDLR